MAALNHYLFWIGFVLSVVVGVTVLFAVFPAYWRSHDRAFLYLAFAYAVGIYEAIADHAIALWHVPGQQHLVYSILRRMVHFAAVILFAVGIIKLTRSYFAKRARNHNSTPVA
jgi:hypothetical protein